MRNTAECIRLHAEILALIERRRAEVGDPSLGSAIERVVLDRHFHDLEQDIFDNPGAMEPWLVRRRRD